MAKPGEPGYIYNPSNPGSLPVFVRGLPEDQRAEWAAVENEKHRIVAVCPECKRNLRKGEWVPHRLKHADNGRIRSAAGTVLNLTPDEVNKAMELLRSILEGAPIDG